MKKDAYYFPHFSNARSDSKLLKLRRVMGIEGYGMYFLLLEVLREQTDFKYPLDNIEDLAYEWHTSKEKLNAVISNFELFTIDKDKFFSLKLIQYLQPYLEKSERARKAALKRWDNANAYANADTKAMQMHSDSNTNAKQVKESKVKESKVKVSKEDIEFIYSLYPLACPIKHSSTGKTKNNKTTIAKLLKSEYTKYELENSIKRYIEDCEKSKTYIKNFGTFLNNIPDYSDSTTLKDVNGFTHVRWRLKESPRDTIKTVAEFEAKKHIIVDGMNEFFKTPEYFTQ